MPVPARQILAPPPVIDFDAVRAELQIPAAYPPEAVARARAAGARPLPDLPDATDIPLVTLDPPGSRDLDQAVHLVRRGTGWRVHYAIADVLWFVGTDRDDPLVAETWRRAVTLYAPDGNTPLHPVELSEGAASLLPDVDRPAVLWTIDLDDRGEVTAIDVHRARVRSRAQLDYPTMQAAADAGRLPAPIADLPVVGELRARLARERHAITLDLPDSEIVRGPDGHWTLTLRAQLPIERHNAEISLLTGVCAARIMLDGGIGLLRTLPSPTEAQVTALRKATAALGIPWPDDEPPGDVIGRLDGSKPRDAAFLEDAVRLLRGAAYTPFDGAPPERTGHGGVGSSYAHVTAPLRRLADRYATEVCLALQAGRPVPEAVRAALPDLPAAMAAGDRTASALDKACAAAVAVFLLHGREGETFPATVLQIDAERDRAVVVLHEPPVRAHCSPTGLTEGSVVTVRLLSADPTTHRFRVEPVRPADQPAGG
ncbi:RNB domain-containing ribonuclease [Nakamurella flava]|uniref:RNB domain-containing ribonuclease n=1 Tax=Nakamurella flava TaxID=2576308 RepID=UPI00197B9AEF|nr:RNB domain-containing ribonuclease [Nakamurella flava]